MTEAALIRSESASTDADDGQKLAPRAVALNNFDLIRLFAATEVAVKHAMVHLELGGPWLETASVLPGVPIFFFISGYLIYQSYHNSGSLYNYAINRVYRLFPALYACLAVGIVLMFAVGDFDRGLFVTRDFWVWLASQTTIVQFYNPDFLRQFGVGVLNGSLWTISVELQFYFLTPILAIMALRWRGIWVAGIAFFVAMNVLYHSLPADAMTTKLAMVTFLPWFYMFMVGAWVSTRPDMVDKIRKMPWIACFAIFGAGIALSLILGLAVVGEGISPLAYPGLALLVIKCAYSRPDLSDKLLKRNDISYGVYIYHMLAVNVAVELNLLRSWPVLVAVLLATFSVAFLSWRLVERPALAAKKRTLRRV